MDYALFSSSSSSFFFNKTTEMPIKEEKFLHKNFYGILQVGVLLAIMKDICIFPLPYQNSS